MRAHFILYVSDQDAATAFYEKVLARRPDLHVPGMTEFRLSDRTVLAVMPMEAITRLLGEKLPHPGQARGIPRSEVYIVVDDPRAFHERALAGGATELSPLLPRNWGDEAAYSLDPDGHVLAFARHAKPR